jgi:hypothetical protein
MPLAPRKKAKAAAAIRLLPSLRAWFFTTNYSRLAAFSSTLGYRFAAEGLIDGTEGTLETLVFLYPEQAIKLPLLGSHYPHPHLIGDGI